MHRLDQFSEDQRKMLIALPYRVGLWVSSSDSSGGDDADEAEQIALQTIVQGFAEDFLKSEFVQRLMEQTVAHRSEWPQWGAHLDEVPAECSRAIELLLEDIDRKELTSFKLTLMEIATAVAMAYREIDTQGNLAIRMRVMAHVMKDRMQAMIGRRKAKTLDELLNISEYEQDALHRLAEALDLSADIVQQAAAPESRAQG